MLLSSGQGVERPALPELPELLSVRRIECSLDTLEVVCCGCTADSPLVDAVRFCYRNLANSLLGRSQHITRSAAYYIPLYRLGGPSDSYTHFASVRALFSESLPFSPQSDCVALLIKFYNEARHAVRVGDPDPAAPVVPEPPASTGASSLLNLPGFFPPPTVSSDELDRLPLLPSDEGSEVFGAFSFDAFLGTPKPAPMQTKDASKKKVGGNKPGRCSICLEPISVKDGDVVVFFCWHAYHLSCLSESEKRGKAAPDEGVEKDADDGLRCVLCTTAAAVRKNAHLLRTTTGSSDRSQARSSVGWGQAVSV